MNPKSKLSEEPFVPTPTPAEIYPDNIPLPPGDGRCMYRYPSGPRCRKPASQIHPYLCDSHLHQTLAFNEQQKKAQSSNATKSPEPETPAPPCDSALADEIAELAGDFSSPQQVNSVMGRIFDSLLHRRITAKEASTLCYIAQTILNGQRTATFIENIKPTRVRTLINDMPMAIRD
jgi:hypothetical protein